MRPEVLATQAAMERQGYIAEPAIATAVFLARALRKPLLIEGDAGVGKTEIAKVLARILDTDLIRLQCYEGIDVNTALYEWNYQRQMLRLRIAGTEGRDPAEVEQMILQPRLPAGTPAAARHHLPRRPAGPADRRDRSRRRRLRGLPAGSPLRLPGHDSRARPHRRHARAVRRADIEPHARDRRRATPPVLLPLRPAPVPWRRRFASSAPRCRRPWTGWPTK